MQFRQADFVTHYIETGDFHIHPVAGQVSRAGEAVNVRPKTLQLLLLLLEARGALVSKEDILGKVWDDVHVDEQVVFQSVKELRKIFGTASVIKTVPRKGYAWTLPVHDRNTTAPSPPKGEGRGKQGFARLASLAALLVVFAGLALTFFRAPDDASSGAGAVIVLPVVNTLTDADHRWVRYGAMDHLIHRLPPSDTYGVYQAGDVLDVVKRAGITELHFTRGDIARIFTVTGASLIVEATLAGTPREYQLLYRLHERGDMEKGALLADSVYGALDQLARVITVRLGRHTVVDESAYHSDFANEMTASALELMQAEDFASAEKFLAAATATEPGNIVAKRLLVQALVSQNKSAEAAPVLATGLQQAHAAGNRHELLRLNYWAGVDRMRNGQWQAGLDFMDAATREADALKEWLYLGYIAELRGHAGRAMGEFEAARQRYRAAVDYHKVIQCPYGQAQGFLNLARVTLDLGDTAGAVTHTQSALKLIESRELHSLERDAAAWKATLDSHLATRAE
jgi:DNA-binding winged helix-turn-helix (wHTH) protein/tetratricopeptide (TPR) repeat protein